MVCSTCLYSDKTYDEEDAFGRTPDGKEVWREDLKLNYCFCFAEPKPKLVSDHIIDGMLPGIKANPNYHFCGRGRWWKDGKWIKWVDIENYSGEETNGT